MKVEIANSFFKSLKKLSWHHTFIYKCWDTIYYDIPRFFRNIILFRKALYNYYWFDSSYMMQFMHICISDMAEKTDKYGNEVKINKDKKVAAMREAAKLIKNKLDDNYIERAEEKLGKLPDHPLDFIESKDHSGCFQFVDHDTPEEKELRTKVYKYARKLEEDEWNQIWDILKGRTHSEYLSWLEIHKHEFTQEELDNFDAGYQFFDGKGMSSWWD